MSRTLHAIVSQGPAPRPKRESLLKQTWLAIDQVTARLPALSATRIRALARSGELEFTQPGPGCKMMISERSLEAYLARGHQLGKFAP